MSPRIVSALLLSLALAQNAGAANEETPKPTCIGNPADPVRVIYLHGLFPPKGDDPFRWRALENDNRIQLEEFAKENHVRIALPIAPVVTPRGYQRWDDDLGLKEMESAAEAACKAKLAPNRCLMGFSRGGNKINDMATKDCGQFKDYIGVVAFGTDSAPDKWQPQKCNGKSKNVPSDDKFLPTTELKNLCGFNESPHAPGAAPTAHSLQ